MRVLYLLRFYKLAAGMFLGAVLIGCTSQTVFGQSSPIGQTINVPLDYKNPKFGRGPLYFEFGAAYDKSKPVVFLIADGQQFYVRRGAIAQLQQRLFGSAFNVIGIVGRGSTQEFIAAAVDQNGKPDWTKAWQLFNSAQWIEDIESVRKTVVGEKGKILLYGRSGGAYLIHQYLSRYGAHVLRAFTQSPVNSFLNRELNIPLDTFWEELGAQDPALPVTLSLVLKQYPAERIGILLSLQRQHFYVAADKLPAARAELIRSLAAGNQSIYEQAKKDYEVEGVVKLSQSAEIIPQNVRALELIYPSGAFQKTGGEGIYPLIETQHHFIKPLLELLDAGKIRPPTFNTTPAHSVTAEVFVLAARWDEAVDYRTTIALAYLYPRHHLFIANDNHVFARLVESGTSSRLIQAFLKFGLEAEEFRNAIQSSQAQRWVN